VARVCFFSQYRCVRRLFDRINHDLSKPRPCRLGCVDVATHFAAVFIPNKQRNVPSNLTRLDLRRKQISDIVLLNFAATAPKITAHIVLYLFVLSHHRGKRLKDCFKRTPSEIRANAATPGASASSIKPVGQRAPQRCPFPTASDLLIDDTGNGRQQPPGQRRGGLDARQNHAACAAPVIQIEQHTAAAGRGGGDG